jgi:creatinine amidohydrolase
MTEVRWHKLRRGQIAALAAADAVVLLPIGSVEQHGPHLPLDTDTDAATAVCERAATLLAADAAGGSQRAVVLPPIWWGLSPYWMPFPGTLTLRPETILALVADLGDSVRRHGFLRLVVVNGHGGNDGLVGVAATMLATAGLRASALSYWALIPDDLRANSRFDGGSIGHAGEVETSIALHRQPDRIADTPPAAECADLVALATAPFADAGYTPPDPASDAPNGVYGRADAGRAELGALVIERAAEQLAAYVRSLPPSPAEARPQARARVSTPAPG